MTEYADVPPRVVAELRSICAALPEAYEDTPWTGARWRIRSGSFVHAVTVVGDDGPFTHINVHAAGDDLEVLVRVGHPFFPGWGPGIVGMVIDDDTDWDEVREVVTDSYCLLAPKKLSALVVRPGE
jgi:predicted DNA-binding protein (MmcQ/YjbR family)